MRLKPYSDSLKSLAFLFIFSLFTRSSTFAQNAIVTENALAGTAAATWDIPLNADGSFGDKSIQGFATDISVNKGGTVNFKITVTTGTNKTFGIKIYRIGYYQGKGARQIADLGAAFAGKTQNACSFNNTTGLTDCGNWTTTASWNVPATAVSGLYVARLTRSAAGGGGASHIAFVVRDDASTSPLYYKTSDATWQAYNGYGGYSLYIGAGMPFNHGNKVSYNRPFLTRDGGGGGGASEDWFMNAEYPMIRFLEKNGYDISYTTDVDISRSATNLILNHKVFLSVGHDEYWSKPARDKVEAARAAGKHLAFFSGNEVYWKTRWENSVDGTNTPYRTLVCYKEGTLPTAAENPCGGKCDPTTEWTGLWRDGCNFPSGNACKPENALTGQMSWDGNTGTMEVPAAYKTLRFWRNSPVANLAAGQKATMTAGTLGYEWDWEQYPASYPPGRITMSSTSFDGHIHKLSLYKSTAGGLVFGAGTVQWSWGLDATHDNNPQGGGGAANQSMQQATINLFADMGVQPATLQSGLTAATASTDVTPPVTVITSPANNTTVNTPTVNITGTATDANVITGVEISFDGGVTWNQATGTTSWSYAWTPPANGTYTIKVHGVDDSGNYTATASATTITVTVNLNATTTCPCNIFGTAAPAVVNENDGLGIVVGTKFRSNTNGTITGIRFFKASGNSGTHTGLLYNSAGTLLAQAKFVTETTSGWQQVSFTTPVTIVSGQTYTAAYLSSAGNYSSTNAYFAQAVVNGPLTGLADGTDGANGVYKYTTVAAFPTSSFQQSNYWVDAVFNNTSSVTANAGPNQSITLPTSTVTLNGSGSSGATTYTWTRVSGPNTPTITTPTSVSTTVTGLIQGTYVFQLSINGGASTSPVTITVNASVPPIANAGPKQTITLPTSTVTLNGSGSTGPITSYTWSNISGPNIPTISTPTTVTTTVTGLIQGTYIFQLAVNGTASTSRDTVIVNPPPPPTANAGSNQTITLPASSVSLSGSGSTGVITSYSWSRVSGPNTPTITTPNAVSTTVTGLIQGTYVFQLSLNGGTSTSQVTVTVNAATATSTIFTTQTPTGTTENDGLALELGVKFRTSVAGTIKGIRFYKTTGNSGTHTGELYSSTGTRLAQAVFSGETTSGWQQVLFTTPVTVSANTTYTAAYFSSAGNYISTTNYFTAGVTNGSVTALADGTDGANGVYKYTSTAAFPNSSYQKSNYWVDVVFSAATTPPPVILPAITLTSPSVAAKSISANAKVIIFFSESLDPASVNNNTVILQNGQSTVASTVVYNTADSSIVLTPSAQLLAGVNYQMTIKGGTGTNKIKDLTGNAMAKDSVWNFSTYTSFALPNPANGPGGPILLISSGANPFSRYPAEILRAEGWNAFMALDISEVTTTEINKYDVVLLGDITLTAAQVTMLSAWVNAGGTLIAFHPDVQLYSLMGISSAGPTLSDKYILVNTATAPGLGIVNQTIQFHGAANLYTVNAGTDILATIYSDATTATIYPAVTSRNVGSLGGQAISFAYDLAKSVVYTRQGNPAWVGQKRDGQIPPIRSDDLFFGNASFDPQPDWVNLNKVAIPQADEQQRLLTNIILAGNNDKKPLPRFWFLPKGKKAAVVMTGDDHAFGGTSDRMDQYLTASTSNTATAVANWDAIRSTSYMYPGTPISNYRIAFLQNQGFELSLHVNPDCSVWTPATLTDYFSTQLSSFSSQYYSATPQSTHRIHCLAWSDWVTLPKTEISNGMRFNVSYYYWPGAWINNRPGMFTGSGMPMRFADTDGSLIDCYQATTQMTDESDQTYPSTITALLNNAVGTTGYYGVFTANMHTDYNPSPGSDAIIQTAKSLQIPVVSSKQMLDWIDGRNNSTFANYTWSNNKLSFTVTQDPRALNLKGMLPQSVTAGSFISLTQNGLAVSTTSETIKGINYVFFDAGSGNYVATYGITAPGGGTAQEKFLVASEDSVKDDIVNYLGQNYPNPFSQNTRINYSIAANGRVEMILYDMAGRPVKFMVNEMKAAGHYEYDLNISGLSKGVYFYRLRSGSFTDVKKLIVQ